MATKLLSSSEPLGTVPAERLEWAGRLYPYQLDGVRALVDRSRVLLADDMGLGKTVQVAAAMRLLVLGGGAAAILLVCPASLVDQWRRELARWAPELRAVAIRGPVHERAWQWRAHVNVFILSYETLRNEAASRTAPARARQWDVVVLDEAQKIKNRTTETSSLAKRLRRRRSWALTGTPLETSLDDLASILEFVDHADDGSPVRMSIGAPLLERHRELQIRRRKVDVLLDLPPKQVVTIDITLLPRQQAAYDRAENEGIVHLRALGKTVKIRHVLELIIRLKQICNADAESGESAKLDDIAERLDELTAEGNRALIFSQFTGEDHGVGRAAVHLRAFEPLTYTGAMSAGQRDAVVHAFKSSSRHGALILSLRAGGVGLNLQEASYVFHLDRWWNPATERQAEDRTHRIGQTVPVTVFRYTAKGTIEERIATVLAERQQLFDEVVDDVSIDLGAQLTSSELFGLFNLEPPPPAASDSRTA